MPTWRLAAALAAGALVVVVAPLDAPVAFVAVNVLLALLAVGDWAAAPRPDDVAIVRDTPAVIRMGGSATVTWRISNPLGRRVRVAFADDLPPSLGATRRRVALTLLPHAHAQALTELRPARRGSFALRDLTLRVDGPLGLVARQSTRPCEGLVRVYPPFRARAEAELRLTRARLAEFGLRAAAVRGGGTEFDALREYTVDDEFGRVDWAATARAGKPIVRTYRAERNQTVLVLLDTGRTMAGLAGDLPRLDHALDATMMLAALATRLGDRAGLVTFAERVHAVVAPSNRADHLARVADALYALEPRLVESDHRAAFVHTLARFRRRTLLVVLTELVAQALEQTLVPALPLVARDHLVIVAAPRDPQVDEWAHAVPTQASTAYRKAAAVQALDQRARITARLQRAGVIVVDEVPGRLAPVLADTYLRVKSTARL